MEKEELESLRREKEEMLDRVVGEKEKLRLEEQGIKAEMDKLHQDSNTLQQIRREQLDKMELDTQALHLKRDNNDDARQ